MSDKYSGGTTDCYPGTTTLINKLGIRDRVALENIEADIVNARIMDLDHLTITGFNVSEFKKLHKYLFSDIYEWAGEFRQCDISKGSTRFCNWLYIEKEASRLERWVFPEGFSDVTRNIAITGLYADLNVLHPFRDGNGRTTRLYIELLLSNFGIEVNWDTVEREEWISACIDSYNGDDVKLLAIFKRIIT